MATGLEMYHALKQAIRASDDPSEIKIHTIDSYDLMKLVTQDLISLGYDDQIAKEVVRALNNADFGPFSKSIGTKIIVSRDAGRLVQDQT